MTPSDKLKLTNMIEQSVTHLLTNLEITDPAESLKHYEKICVSILQRVDPQDADDVITVLEDFLVKKSKKLGIERDYRNEQEVK